MNGIMGELNFKYKLFGGEIGVVLYETERVLVSGIMEEFYAEALRLQSVFNFYDSKSELSLLNKEREREVSDELLSVIRRALVFCKITNGKYDITLGKKILSRKLGKLGENVSCSYRDIEIRGGRVKLLNKDILIDLGSIAKGYITDRLVEFLKKKGVKEFLIDSRGDLFVSGRYEHILGIEHPRAKGKELGRVNLKNKAIATSGDYKQFKNSYDNSHIINSDRIISVTVIADNLEEADVYATALFVANFTERKKLAELDKGVKILCIDKDLKQEEHNGFRKCLAK